jgi:hypothetical protein
VAQCIAAREELCSGRYMPASIFPCSHAMPISLRRRSLTRILFALAVCFFLRLVFFSSSSPPTSSFPLDTLEIKEQNIVDRVTRSDKTLNVQKHKFLQVRMGRDDRDDLLVDVISNGVMDYWERFQKP